jgi:hypothetical protein
MGIIKEDNKEKIRQRNVNIDNLKPFMTNSVYLGCPCCNGELKRELYLLNSIIKEKCKYNILVVKTENWMISQEIINEFHPSIVSKINKCVYLDEPLVNSRSSYHYLIDEKIDFTFYLF